MARRTAPAIAGVLAVVGWAVVAAVPAYSADRQQGFTIEHVTDTGTHKSWWSVLNDGADLPKNFAGKWKRGDLPYSDRQRWLTSAAPDAAAKAPAVQLQSASTKGQRRTVTIRLASNGNDNVALVGPPDAHILSAGALGFVRPIDQNGSGRYTIACYGRSCDGATLILTIAKPQPVHFILVGSRPGLPPGAAPLLAARPRFARPQYTPDESIGFTRVNL